MVRFGMAVIVVLLYPVLVLGGSGVVTGRSPGRLVYVFSPDCTEHRHRALQLQDWVAGRTGTELLFGLLAHETANTPDGPDLGALRLPLLSSTQLRDAGLPADALRQAPDAGDYAMYFNNRNKLQWTARGVDVPVRLQSQTLPTDVGSSTWGKIKELFQ